MDDRKYLVSVWVTPESSWFFRLLYNWFRITVFVMYEDDQRQICKVGLVRLTEDEWNGKS